MENDDLPFDAVERVREIRRRHHEETKHMTREEFREHNRKRYEEAKEWMATIEPDPSRFPFLPQK
ncbi:MAG: hypothetical protein FWE67_15970 [Planctomycetaceae bacterium]|nr:hypothetical protein [Planctomycetaceae bacterium]